MAGQLVILLLALAVPATSQSPFGGGAFRPPPVPAHQTGLVPGIAGIPQGLGGQPGGLKLHNSPLGQVHDRTEGFGVGSGFGSNPTASVSGAGSSSWAPGGPSGSLGAASGTWAPGGSSGSSGAWGAGLHGTGDAGRGDRSDGKPSEGFQHANKLLDLAEELMQQARFLEAKGTLVSAAQLTDGSPEVIARAGLLRWRMGLPEVTTANLDAWLGWRIGGAGALAAAGSATASAPGGGAGRSSNSNRGPPLHRDWAEAPSSRPLGGPAPGPQKSNAGGSWYLPAVGILSQEADAETLNRSLPKIAVVVVAGIAAVTLSAILLAATALVTRVRRFPEDKSGARGHEALHAPAATSAEAEKSTPAIAPQVEEPRKISECGNDEDDQEDSEEEEDNVQSESHLGAKAKAGTLLTKGTCIEDDEDEDDRSNEDVQNWAAEAAEGDDDSTEEDGSGDAEDAKTPRTVAMPLPEAPEADEPSPAEQSEALHVPESPELDLEPSCSERRKDGDGEPHVPSAGADEPSGEAALNETPLPLPLPAELRSQLVQIGGRTLSLYELCQELGARSATPGLSEKLSVGGSASVDVVENVPATQPEDKAPAPDDSDVRNNGEDDAAAEVIHAGVHAEFLDDEEWEDFVDRDEQEAKASPATARPATSPTEVGDGQTYDISGRLEGIAEEQSDEVEESWNSKEDEEVDEEEEGEEEEECEEEEEEGFQEEDEAVEVELDEQCADEASADEEDWGWDAAPRPETILKEELPEASEPELKDEEPDVALAIAKTWRPQSSSWGSAESALTFQQPEQQPGEVPGRGGLKQRRPRSRPAEEPAEVHPDPEAAGNSSSSASRIVVEPEEKPQAAADGHIYFVGSPALETQGRPATSKTARSTGRSWKPGGQRTYTGGDVKRKPREDDSEEEWPDDAEFEFREDEKFLQARPTRIRPTGCFVKLPGGIEAFLPVEHMMPRTEASSTAVRERVQVKKGAGESRLLVRDIGDGFVSMLSANDAAARGQELEARRRKIEDGITYLRDNWDPEKWMTGIVSLIREDGVYVGVVEGKDALIPIKEMPEQLIGSDTSDIKDGKEAVQKPLLKIGQEIRFRVIRHNLQSDNFTASMLSSEESLGRSRSSRGRPSDSRETTTRKEPRQRRASEEDEIDRAPSPDRSEGSKVWADKGFSVVNSSAADELNAWLRSKIEEKKGGGKKSAAPSTAVPVKASEKTYVVNVSSGMNTKVLGNVMMDAKGTDKELKQLAIDLVTKEGLIKSGQTHKGVTITKNIVTVKV